MAWKAEERESGEVHTYPIDDLIDLDGVGCVCLPRCEIVVLGAPMLVHHNSLDGRELNEPDYQAAA